MIFGIDANCPKADRPNIWENEWWWEEEPLLLGPEPLHVFKDSYRIFLENNPDEMQWVLIDRPNGPLAISHVRGNSRRFTDCRYDFIYVSPEVLVKRVTYDFGGIVRALSDHALVFADLSW